MDEWTHDGHNAMTIACWPLASGVKKLQKSLDHKHHSVVDLPCVQLTENMFATNCLPQTSN